MATKTKTPHQSYLANSDYYLALYEAYGSTLSEAMAERVAGKHGFTMRELWEEGDVCKRHDGKVSTLGLVMGLGY